MSAPRRRMPPDFEARILEARRAGLSLRETANLIGCCEAHISQALTEMRKRGVAVPDSVARGPNSWPMVHVFGRDCHGYPRRVIAATRSEALAAWWRAGGEIERIVVIQ